MNVLDVNEFSRVVFDHGVFEVKIEPFKYQNGKYRLPRKSSKSYDMVPDIQYAFGKMFECVINELSHNSKFKVCIIVYNGSLDRLGGADLDNYCKAILDGVTSTNKVWKDDRQVDEIHVKRKYINGKTSSIYVKIEQILD